MMISESANIGREGGKKSENREIWKSFFLLGIRYIAPVYLPPPPRDDDGAGVRTSVRHREGGGGGEEQAGRIGGGGGGDDTSVHSTTHFAPARRRRVGKEQGEGGGRGAGGAKGSFRRTRSDVPAPSNVRVVTVAEIIRRRFSGRGIKRASCASRPPPPPAESMSRVVVLSRGIDER